MTITVSVNGQVQRLEADPATPLLYVLREDLGLNGAKYGCGLGQCGACTVQIDGKAAFSCVTPLAAVEGREVRTVEGLGTIDRMNPLQQAFVEEQAAQCGYCIAGMIMRAQALLDINPTPSDAGLLKTLERACETVGARHRRMASGAGHDMAWIAKVAPAAMIFVPCKEGRSHSADEWAENDDIALGAAVLFEAVMDMDKSLKQENA